MKLQIYRVNKFIQEEIAALIFSCEFCEISHNTNFKKPFEWPLLHKYSFCLLSHNHPLFYRKRCHIYFLAEYFLDLIYRLGTKRSLIFQTLSQTPFSNIVKHLRPRFSLENSQQLKAVKYLR